MGSLVQHGRDPSGHLYRRNRYYDPATGRFTQEDPIGLAGGVNAYGFGKGDPVSFADPYGLKVCFNGSGGARTLEQFAHNALRLAEGAATATNTKISLHHEPDGEWCVTKARVASRDRRYAGLQRRLFGMIRSETTFTVQTTVGGSEWLESDKTALIGGDVGLPIQGCSGKIMRSTTASTIAHELLGHGTQGKLRGSVVGQVAGSNESYATDTENEYHAIASADTRCRGEGVER